MNKTKNHPPKTGQWVLSRIINNDIRYEALGDFHEIYCFKVEHNGKLKAQSWYWLQVFNSLFHFLFDQLYWRIDMFKNYFKTAFRNIKRHKAYSFINISGLAIGMAACILLSIYINSELSFDNYHTNGERIFKVGQNYSFKNYNGKGTATNAVIAKALKETYPEVEDAVRFRYMRASVKYNDKQFTDRFYYADKTVFNIFTWPLIEGDPQTALSAPYSIVLTKETAQKYFENEDPIGKTIILNENDEFKVTGIMEEVPRYSTMNFKGLCSFSTFYARQKEIPRMLTTWTSHNFRTFVLLKEGTDHLTFENKVKDIYSEYAAEALKTKGATYKVFLQPLKDVYLRPVNQDFGPISYVYIFSAVAIFVLLIACVNFMNLSTARSMTRAAEVGVRKVFGANRSKLINQFLSEAVLLSIVSVIIGGGIVFFLLPVISNFAGRDLMQDIYEMPWLIPGIIGITVLVGLIAGSYPAFFLSKFEAAHVIKNKSNSSKSNILFRRVLVFVQFAISITLIIGTGLIIQQLDYLKNKDAGFDKEQVICLSIRDDFVRQNLPVLKEKVKNLPNILNVGAGSGLPGWGAALNDKIPEGFSRENTQLMREINVDEDYFQTMGIKIIEGRNFSKEYGNDPRGSVIINETAAKQYGWENPIGKTIQTSNFDIKTEKVYESRKVIGVVKDYHIAGVTTQIEPAFISCIANFPFYWGSYNVVVIKTKPGNIQATLTEIENIWKEVSPGKPYNPYFLDEEFNEQFIDIEQSRDILSYFTFLAVFIACLGLFGMASYSAEKRTKEIGIRKTLGCSVAQIIGLLSKELIILVLLANVLAYPIAYTLINQWLQDFPYHININIYTFILSTLLAIGISMVTIISQTIKAAVKNPVESLRHE